MFGPHITQFDVGPFFQRVGPEERQNPLSCWLSDPINTDR